MFKNLVSICLLLFLVNGVFGQTEPEITSVKVDGNSLSITGGSITLEMRSLETFNFEIKVKNKGDDSPNGNNWTTVSFSSFTDPSDQDNISVANATSNDFKVHKHLGYADLTTSQTRANGNYFKWLAVEASDDNFKGPHCILGICSDRVPNNLSLDITPKTYGDFYIYYRVQMMDKDDQLTKLPSSGNFSGPVGESNYRIRVIIKRPNSAPTAPSNPKPQDGQTNVSLRPILDWVGSTDIDGDDVNYKVFLEAGDSSPDNQLGTTSISSLEVSQELEYDTKYYWKIIAFDGNGGEVEGPVWSFKTQEQESLDAEILGVSFNSSEFIYGHEQVKATIKIKNTGNTRGTFYIGASSIHDSGPWYDYEPTRTSVALDAKETADVSLTWSPQSDLEPGIYGLYTKIFEQSSGNSFYDEYWKEKAFNLVEPLSAVEISMVDFDRDIVYTQSDQITASITLKNTGNISNTYFVSASAKNLNNSHWYNFEPNRVAKTIEPGEVESIQINWNPPEDAEQGYYLFYTKVFKANSGEDYYSEFSEANAFAVVASTLWIEPWEGDPKELGERQPLLLVHGWQPYPKPAEPSFGIWYDEQNQDDQFVGYYRNNENLEDHFKIYKVLYWSNLVSMEELGSSMRIAVENISEFEGKKLSVLAHSMGGLVSRSFMDQELNSVRGGELVEKLITLGSPHHGTPVANGNIRIVTELFDFLGKDFDIGYVSLVQIIDVLLYAKNSPLFNQHSRVDLQWDNYIKIFPYNLFPDEANDYLTHLNSDETFDDIIFPFVGTFDFQSRTEGNEGILHTVGNKYMKEVFDFMSDGIVPTSSANFAGHKKVNKADTLEGYDHKQIGKGKIRFSDKGVFDDLFIKIGNILLEKKEAFITLSTDRIDFYDVLENKIAQEKLIITNTGSQDLVISSIVFSEGSSNEFSLNNIEEDIVLDSEGQGLELTIEFFPTSNGGKNAVLEIISHTVNSTSEKTSYIEVTGSGVEVTSKELTIPQEGMLDFGDAFLENKSTEFLTLQNIGSTDLSIDLEISGTDVELFSIINPFDKKFTLSKGVSENIIVQFFPTSVGDKYAKLIISNDSDNAPNLEIVLKGKGIEVGDFDAQLSNSGISENNQEGAVVGTLSTSNEGTFVYTLSEGEGDTDNSSFEIAGNQIITTKVFDFEEQLTQTVRIKTCNSQSQCFEKVFVIDIIDVNETPTDIALSIVTIPENKEVGYVVGALTSEDPDLDEQLTYSLIADDGDTDNDSFSIDGDQLLASESFDFETKYSYSIRIKTTDKEGESFEKVFTITINDINEAPTEITLDQASINENNEEGALIGSLVTTDPDASDAHTYSLVAGEGGTDNALFSIAGNQLLASESFDYEAKSSYSIRIKTTDKEGEPFEKVFTVTINDINEAPSEITLDQASMDENNAVGELIGSLTTTDPDASDTHTYNLVAGEGDTDNALFSIAGDQLLASESFDFEVKSSYSIRIKTTDKEGEPFEKAFTIAINDINDVPTAIGLSNMSIEENSDEETVIGTFTTTDQDADDEHTYSLEAGVEDNDLFQIVADQLQTKQQFDYETQTNYSIRVKTDDGNGGVYQEPFTIEVTNVIEASIELSEALVFEGTALGTNSTPKEFTITNTGEKQISVTVTSPSATFMVDPSSAELNIGQKAAVMVRFNPLVAKTYQEEIVVSFEDGKQERLIEVTGEGAIITSADKGILKDAEIKVYPNPAKNEITVDLSPFVAFKAELRLISPDGKELISLKNLKKDKLILDTSGFPSGVYVIRISGDFGQIIKKVIIKR